MKYRFPCGCEWPVIGDPPAEGALPLMDVDTVRPRFPFCGAAWQLLSRGETKGVFQLETSLGRQWTKKLRPESGEHMGALGALLRPGCLRAVDDKGVSMTLHYCRRKNNEEQTEIFHPSIEWVLKPTYGVLTYQEQAMEIARTVAGFSLQDADVLRKAIGKKLPEEMAKVKKMFLQGVEKARVVGTAEGDEMFGWIEKSQRYSFNKSHAISYGLIGYDSAYVKAHWPVAFFTSWLRWGCEKADPLQEIYELVQEAKLFDILVEPPDLRTREPHFSTDGLKVRFGLSDIKGVGEAQVTKMVQALVAVEAELGRGLSRWSWFEFLVYFSKRVPCSLVERLISAGALRWFKMPRQQMLAEFKAWAGLTEKEQDWVLRTTRAEVAA